MTNDKHDDHDGAAGALGSGIAAGIAHKALQPIIGAVREEIDSARREVGDRISGAKTGVVLLVVGGVLALVALMAAAALAVVLLAAVLPLTAAVAIVFAALTVAALIVVLLGLRGIRRGVPPVPRDTLHSARERVSEAIGHQG